MDQENPLPPPEAVLIRTAREAAGMTAAQAARASAGAVSAIYWRDVERGHGGRRGQQAPTRASAKMLAAMARVTDVTPEQLDGAEREDAARVLREILRRGDGEPEAPRMSLVPDLPPTPGDDLDRVVAEMIGGQEREDVKEALRALWRLPLPAQERLAMLRMTLDFAAGVRPPEPGGRENAGGASLLSLTEDHDQVKPSDPV